MTDDPQSSPEEPVEGPTRMSRLAFHLPADLTLYAALTGGPPVIDPSLANPLVAATLARKEHPWSPAALGTYVREVVRAKGSHLNRPEVAAWVKRQSAIARKRLAETQARVTGGVVVGSRYAEDDGD
jgi:hypothetical protein